MLITKKTNKVIVSQYLGLGGTWDILTYLTKTKNKIYLELILRIPVGKATKGFPNVYMKHKDIEIATIYFPSLQHISEWGKLITKMANTLNKIKGGD